MHKKHWFRKLLVLFMINTMLVSLVWVATGIASQTVPDKNRIPLQKSGSQEGTWESPPITFKYQFSREKDKIKISGILTVGRTSNPGVSSQYSFWVYLLDAEGVVLRTDALFSGGVTGKSAKQKIDKQLDAAASLTAIAFGFRGTVRTPIPGVGAGYDIYHYKNTPFE